MSLLSAHPLWTNYTRPDDAIAVSYMARFVTALIDSDFAHVVDFIKYLKGTPSHGLCSGD
jgi:hypothetical protein